MLRRHQVGKKSGPPGACKHLVFFVNHQDSVRETKLKIIQIGNNNKNITLNRISKKEKHVLGPKLSKAFEARMHYPGLISKSFISKSFISGAHQAAHQPHIKPHINRT